MTTTNNASDQSFINNADGFTIGGGTTQRTLTVTSGSPTVTGNASGIVSTMPPATTTVAGLSTSQTFSAAQTVTAPINPGAVQTSLSGTTAGTIVSSQPFQGASLQLFYAYASGYENNTASNQTITFPNAFTNTPVVVANNTGLTISVSTTILTITAPNNTSTFTGNILVVGV